MGRNELRPYEDDSVDVIGHNDECIKGHIGKLCGQFLPRRPRLLPNVVQSHVAVGYPTEQTFPAARADSYEIRARLLVIVSFEPD